MEDKEKTDAEILMEHFRENYSYDEMFDMAVYCRYDVSETDEKEIQHEQVMKGILARMYNIGPSQHVHVNNEDADKEN